MTLLGTICLFWIFSHQPINAYYHTQPEIFSIEKKNSKFGFSVAYVPFINEIIIGDPENSNIYFAKPKANPHLSAPVEGKENFGKSWFGATITSGKNFYAVCGPKQVLESKPFATTKGYCLVKSLNSPVVNSLQVIPYDYKDGATILTLRSSPFDAMGWSMDVDDNGELLVGNPLKLGDLNSSFFKYKNPEKDNYNYITTSDTDCKFNFGYSMASGNFLSKDKIYHAISSTFGEYGEGKVMIFDETNQKLKILSGEIGSMYGASLCPVQLGEEKKSLLIGAPTYSDDNNGNGAYDRGRVYLYTSGGNSEHEPIITGSLNGGYFGFSITNVGDLDGDNMDEVAIGAPYENDKRGAVYIYSIAGRSFGKLLQKIEGPEHVLSFGYSLATMSSNDKDCRDLIVGAPFSKTVLVYSCLASVTVTLDAVIPNLQNRVDKTYFDFESKVLVKYPSRPKNIKGEIQITVEIIHGNAKLANLAADIENKVTYIVSLEEKKAVFPRNIKVLTPETGNYDIPIRYKIQAKLRDDPLVGEYATSKVVLSGNSLLEKKDQIWAADCDNVGGGCKPILSVQLKSTLPDSYVFGSSERENITLSINNEGDTAYSACVELQVDNVNIIPVSSTCNFITPPKNLVCSPASPLHKKDTMTSYILLNMNSLTSKAEGINIKYDVYNHCDDKTDKQSFSKFYNFEWNVRNFEIKGNSFPEDVVNITTSDATKGKQWEHLYTVTYTGYSTWVDVECHVLIPKAKYLESKIISESTNIKYFDMPENIRAVVNIGDISIGRDKNVRIQFKLLPDKLDNIFGQQNNVLVDSEIQLILRTDTMKQRTTTVLQQQTAVVPVWMIIVAVLIGLLILLLIGFILYKKGCFERKNKKKLDELKDSLVHNNAEARASIRRSIRNSQRKSNPRLTSSQQGPDAAGQSGTNTSAVDQCRQNTSVTKQSGQNTSAAEQMRLDTVAEHGEQGNYSFHQ